MVIVYKKWFMDIYFEAHSHLGLKKLYDHYKLN